MTALLFYYILFVTIGIVICLITYKVFDLILDLFSDLIKKVTK